MKLIVSNGQFKGKEFEIFEGSNLIGRWDPSDIAYPEIDLEEIDVEAKISRKHCVIHNAENLTTIEDVGSLNGTFVNQQKLEFGAPIKLANGDQVIVGGIVLLFSA